MRVEVSARIKDSEERKAFMAWVRTHAHGYSELGEMVYMSVTTDNQDEALGVIRVFEQYQEHTITYHNH